MKSYKILIYIMALNILGIFSCKTIFFRSAEVPFEPTWSEVPGIVAFYKAKYKEKDPWNPLNGTTIKKSYFTEISGYQVNNDGSLSKNLFTIQTKSWLEPGAVFYHHGNQLVYAMRGINDEFGTFDRDVVTINVPNGEEKTIWKKNADQAVWEILPSPDGSILFFMTSTIINQEASSFKIHFYNIKTTEIKTYPLKFPGNSMGHFILWNETGNAIYIRSGKKVYSIDVEGKTIESKSFPECAYPGTSFGERKPDSGFIWDSANNKLISAPPKPAHGKWKMISNPENVKDCRQ